MKVYDLTLPISEKIPTFLGSPVPHFIEWDSMDQDDYNLEMIFFSTHTGTHIDAPYHFVKSGKKIHELDPSRFLQNAILIRIQSKPNYSITKSDIIQFEKKHGKIPDNSTIVFATGWNDKPRKDFFANPGLAESASKYLTSKKTNLVGIDSPSIDSGNNTKYVAHHVLLKANVLILENLCNLSKIKSVNFNLVALPLKLQGTTGSPVRAIAF
jgi:kynurenine formamidase